MAGRELSVAEWNVLESLWAGAPKIGSRIVEDLHKSVGWSRSTTLTMLRRMSEKGLIGWRDINHIKAYFPLLDREEAVHKETESFLNRVYQGEAELLLDALTARHGVTREMLEAAMGKVQK